MKKILGLVAILMLMAGSSMAQVQAGLGALSGVVMDATKAVVPGAHVVLDNPSIGLHMEATANGAGEFKFQSLTVIGGYALKVTAPGFAVSDVKNITTSVGTVITQNVTLIAGSASTVVEVQGGSVEQVQTDTSSLSQLVDSTIWKSSPLETRSQNSFINLVAGATPDNTTGRGAAVNGARTGAGNFLVDGFDNNDQGQGGAGTTFGTGGAVTTISPDAIQEFRVITHIPPAEYGRAGGFSTDTVLKSGTQQWHGSAFEYNRIQALTANNFFSNRAGSRDHLVRNQFGGSIGGPVYKDKTFFFATAEFQRLRQSTPLAGTGTTQDFVDFVKSGAFEQFMEGTAQNTSFTYQDQSGNTAYQQGACPLNLGTTCPGVLSGAATLGPVFTKLLAAEPGAFPLATGPFNNQSHVAQGLYTSNTAGGDVYFPVPVYGAIFGSQASNTNQERGSMKLDHKLTEHDQLSFTYLIDFENSVASLGGGGNTFGTPETQVGGSQNFGASWTHTFSPTLLNQFKASYLRHVSNFASPGTTGVFEEFTADALTEGFGASSGLPQLFTDTAFSYEDAITKTVGNNTLKGGFRFVRTRNGSSFYNDITGTVAPWSVEGLLTDGQSDQQLDDYFAGGLGGLYYASASVDASNPSQPTLPDAYRGYRANEFAAYFQDDIKFSSRFTINAGLRWEYFGPPHNFKSGIDSNVYFGSATSVTPNGNPFLPNTPFMAGIQGATFQLAQSNGRSTIWNRDTNNFAPRLGFAYDTMGNGRLVLRGGFGIGFDRLYNNVYENIRFNSPHFADNSVGYGAGSAIPASLDLFPGLYQVPFSPTGGNYALQVAGGKPVPRHIDQNLVTAYYEQTHLGFESSIIHGYVLEANYIGTFGRKLVGLKDANDYDGRTSCPTLTAACVAAGFTAPVTARPNLLFNGDNFRTNGFNSNYNGGQISLRKSYSNGLQLLANYTYSKALDTISDVFSTRTAATGITDPLNPSYDYGPADFDLRHNIVVTANYELQVSNKKNLLTAGWSVAPILSMRSGTPFSIIDSSSSYNPNKDGRPGVDRAVYTGTGSVKSAIVHGISPADGYLQGGDNIAFKPYTCPATVNFGLWCDPPSERNELTGPRFYNLDLGVLKHFYLTEKKTVSLEANFFNIFNHPNFSNPVSDVNNGSFGQSQSIVGDNPQRVIQLSGRFDF